MWLSMKNPPNVSSRAGTRRYSYQPCTSPLSSVAHWMYLHGDARDEARALVPVNAACVRACGLHA